MKSNIITIALAALCPIGAFAQQNAVDNAVRAILESNIELKAERARYDAELEESRSENTLAGPEADFDYRFAPSGVENRWGVSVKQAFDWPGTYSARSKANGYRQEAFQLLWRAKSIDLALEAKSLIFDHIKAEQNRKLLAEAKTNISKLSEYLGKAFEHGNATILEVMKAKRELLAIEKRLSEADIESRKANENIKILAGGDFDLSGIDRFPSEPLRGHGEYRSCLAENNPSVAAATSLVEAAKAEVSVARRSALPGLSIGFIHDFEEGMHFNGFSVGISLPFWGKNRKAAAAKAALSASMLDRDLAARRLIAEMDADYSEALAMQASLKGFRESFDNDKDYIKLLDKAFYGGQLTIFDYLRELNDYIDFKLDFIDLEYRYSVAAARLNRYWTDAND